MNNLSNTCVRQRAKLVSYQHKSLAAKPNQPSLNSLGEKTAMPDLWQTRTLLSIVGNEPSSTVSANHFQFSGVDDGDSTPFILFSFSQPRTISDTEY
ncbi:hypothetical protein VNO80_12829 [Phaseolus coccineus]|uniref:Uncharacterized protein n=1 Tax=Phaseolus coccineus TaxID=3886 RepID=A0AAN9N5D2_PHACN